MTPSSPTIRTTCGAAGAGSTWRIPRPRTLRFRAAEGVSKLTVDSPIPYLLSDLTNLIQTEMGKLDKAGDSAPYLRLKTKIDEIKADPRYGFMLSGMLVADTMSAFLGNVFRLPSNGKPISIIDQEEADRKLR